VVRFPTTSRRRAEVEAVRATYVLRKVRTPLSEIVVQVYRRGTVHDQSPSSAPILAESVWMLDCSEKAAESPLVYARTHYSDGPWNCGRVEFCL
jgi:hypothetical protein